jgi:serine protease Do
VLDVLPQLQNNGLVVRGYLGVGLTTLSPELRGALRLEPRAGALVQDVLPETPAERAGLRPYDVIVAADGRPVTSDEALLRYVASRMPGTATTLDLWRDGRSQTVTAKLSVRASQAAVSLQAHRPGEAADEPSGLTPLGIRVRELDRRIAADLRIPALIQGVLVVEVDPAGPARLAQVKGNQVILEVNRRPVHSVAQFHAAVRALRPGDTAALLVYDKASGQRIICAVTLDAAP